MMIQPRTIRISAKRNKTLRLKCYFHCLTFYSSIILISCISREAVIKRRPYIPYYIYNIDPQNQDPFRPFNIYYAAKIQKIFLPSNIFAKIFSGNPFFVTITFTITITA